MLYFMRYGRLFFWHCIPKTLHFILKWVFMSCRQEDNFNLKEGRKEMTVCTERMLYSIHLSLLNDLTTFWTFCYVLTIFWIKISSKIRIRGKLPVGWQYSLFTTSMSKANIYLWGILHPASLWTASVGKLLFGEKKINFVFLSRLLGFKW